ncbi:MAG: hypothetical protein ACON31_06250 [Candidatus Puniceispirillaceae bacterium]
MMQGNTPQTSHTAADAAAETVSEEPSAIVRNLGMIKAASVVMGVLIIILSAVVIATVVSRLSQTAAPDAEISLTIPDNVRVLSAAADDDGLTLFVEGPSGRQIWRISPSGERYQTITLVAE